MFNSDLKVTFIAIVGLHLPLLGACIDFLISLGLMLFAEVELSIKVDSYSLVSIESSIPVSASSYASSSTNKSLRNYAS